MRNDHIPDTVPNDLVQQAVAAAAERASNTQTVRQEADSTVAQSFTRGFDIGPMLAGSIFWVSLLVFLAWIFR